MAPMHWERVKKIEITAIDVTSATPLFRNQYSFITSGRGMALWEYEHKMQ